MAVSWLIRSNSNLLTVHCVKAFCFLKFANSSNVFSLQTCFFVLMVMVVSLLIPILLLSNKYICESVFLYYTNKQHAIFPVDGVLSLFNISMETSGYYVCTSANKIRSAKCNITLSVMPRKIDAIFSSWSDIMSFCFDKMKKQD